eukprot:Lankesteria_metandrocarpae@DN5351_c1_g1_i1.p1
MTSGSTDRPHAKRVKCNEPATAPSAPVQSVEVAWAALLTAPETTVQAIESHKLANPDDCTADDGTLGVSSQFHCDFCGMDISNNIRIRCAECSDFDLCVDCFSRGREAKSHSNHHGYMPVGHNTFSLFTKDWNADEELMLLEGVSKFGLGYWSEIAELVAPYSRGKLKKKEECEKHYLEIYLRSKANPLPDISRILGAPRDNANGALSANGTEPWLSENAAYGANTTGGGFDSSASAGLATGIHVAGTGSSPKADHSGSSSFSTPKPPVIHQSPASMVVGYMPLRGDFDVEHDNEAELVLADMEFRDTEGPHEKELKLHVLEMYNSKLDERLIRRNVVIERNLLDTKKNQQLEKKRTKEERELYNLLRPVARFNIEADHDRLVALLVEERKMRQRMQKLQEWHSLGLQSAREVRTYEEEKRRRQESKAKRNGRPFFFEGAARLRKGRSKTSLLSPILAEMSNTGMNSSVSGTGNARVAAKKTISSLSVNTPASSPIPANTAQCAFVASELPGAELCQDKELEFCQELMLPPVFFLTAKTVFIRELQRLQLTELNRKTVLDKATFTKLLKLDPNHTGLIYDFISEALSDAYLASDSLPVTTSTAQFSANNTTISNNTSGMNITTNTTTASLGAGNRSSATVVNESNYSGAVAGTTAGSGTAASAGSTATSGAAGSVSSNNVNSARTELFNSSDCEGSTTTTLSTTQQPQLDDHVSAVPISNEMTEDSIANNDYTTGTAKLVAPLNSAGDVDDTEKSVATTDCSGKVCGEG